MTGNMLRDFEETHNLATYEACRVLGVPYTTYMRNRKADELPIVMRYHVEALNLLDSASFRLLCVARTDE